MDALPFIDEHSREIDASPDRAWRALPGASAGGRPDRGSSRIARILGCEQSGVSGTPGEVGSTVPGFRVARSEPPRELALEGRHRFARYELLFRVDDLGRGRSRVRAETRALFPGARGSAYRALVIGSRGHVAATRRMLGGVARRAEGGRMPA